MSNSIPGAQPSPVSWHEIKETALKNENLRADIRVGSDSKKVFSGIFSGICALWENIKAYFGDSTALTKEKTLENLKEHLCAHIVITADRLAKEIGCEVDSEGYNEISKNIEQAFEKICQQLDTDLAADSSTSTSEAIQKAHLAAEETLVDLRNKFATPDQAPQIIALKNREGEPTGKYSLIRPAAPVENAVFSGGGAKGFSNKEMVALLEKHDILGGVKNIAGSSVGAISAALLAGGLDAATFAEKSKVTSSDIFSELTESVSDNLKFTGRFGSKGHFMADHVNTAIAESIKDFLCAIEIDLESDNLKISPEEKVILERLKTDLNSFTASQVHITFQHLDILHKINPEKFKNLTVTGFNKSKQELAYYNAKDFPDMAIGEALRISMSLPLIFKAIKTSEGKFVDGGVDSNLPSEALVSGHKERIAQLPAMTQEAEAGGKSLVQQIANYESSDLTPMLPIIDGKLTDRVPFLKKDISSQNDASKTLILEFDHHGYFQDVVQGDLYVEPSLGLSLLSRITGNKKLQDSRIADRYKLWEAGPNALMVPHGELTNTSFGASESKIKAAQLQAKVRMTEQLALRQNQATYEVFDSYQEAIDSLSASERKDFIGSEGYEEFFNSLHGVDRENYLSSLSSDEEKTHKDKMIDALDSMSPANLASFIAENRYLG